VNAHPESPTPEELTALRDAVLRALPPKPGRVCDAILVVTVWVDQAGGGTPTMDFMATPPEAAIAVARGVRAFIDDLEGRAS
jgi:hypothetical protein